LPTADRIPSELQAGARRPRRPGREGDRHDLVPRPGPRDRGLRPVTGALTGWFAATATDDDTASTTVENQVSTVDPSSDIPTDQGPVFGDQEPTSPSDDDNYSGGAPDTKSGAS